MVNLHPYTVATFPGLSLTGDYGATYILQVTPNQYFAKSDAVVVSVTVATCEVGEEWNREFRRCEACAEGTYNAGPPHDAGDACRDCPVKGGAG